MARKNIGSEIMSIQTDSLFCILDNSQLSPLLSKNKVLYLNSPDFLRKYGFSIIFYEHFIETGQNNTQESFNDKFRKLASVNTFKYIGMKNMLLPRIVDLFEYEIFLRYKYGNINIDELKNLISENISDFIIPSNVNDAELLSQINKSSKLDKLFWSILNAINTESFFNTNIVEVIKSNPKLRPRDLFGAIEHAYSPIKDRFKKQEESKNLMNEYFNEIKTKKHVPSYASGLLFKNAIKQGVEKNLTLESFTYELIFEVVKEQALNTYKIQDNNLKNLGYNDTLLWKLFFNCLKSLTSDYQKNKVKKIQLSDIYDIYFLCCSVLFKTYVDKRTFALGKKIELKLGINLIIEKAKELEY